MAPLCNEHTEFFGHIIFFFLEEKRASNEENNNPHTRMWKERERGGGYCIFLYSRWYKPYTGSVAEAIVVNFLLSFVCVCVSFCVKSEKWLQLRFGSLIIIIYS